MNILYYFCSNIYKLCFYYEFFQNASNVSTPAKLILLIHLYLNLQVKTPANAHSTYISQHVLRIPIYTNFYFKLYNLNLIVKVVINFNLLLIKGISLVVKQYFYTVCTGFRLLYSLYISTDFHLIIRLF